MKRLVYALLLALVLLIVLGLIGACAPGRQAVLPDRPGFSVRLPPAEAVDIRLGQERAPRPPRSSPPSVTDESAGRWLTLFEMNVTPSETAGVPRAPAESP